MALTSRINGMENLTLQRKVEGARNHRPPEQNRRSNPCNVTIPKQQVNDKEEDYVN